MVYRLFRMLALGAIAAQGCGDSSMTDPGDPVPDDKFYDGDEKADGTDPPRPIGGTKGRRGALSDFDPGPPPGSRWAELFAATPNFRALGIGVLGGAALTDEKYRWEFGPIYYRGTLQPESARVLVVGQEGAQDESVSNRDFTGSTGTKLQNFLRAIGIDKSRLFMNTFVYTIHGQYAETDGTVSPQVRWLAQSLDSPIVQQRHALFNYTRETNPTALRLVIGVGQAGRDSVVTWIQSLWEQQGAGLGKTKCGSISKCDGSVVGPKVRVLGLPHPGAASERNGGDSALTSLSSQFSKAVAVVASWAKADPAWLPADPTITSRFAYFKYLNAPLPLADSPWGAMGVLGDWGTTSNRRDGDQSIQVYSSNGCYNNAAKDTSGKCEDPLMGGMTLGLSYSYPSDKTTSIPELKTGDLAYEPPRVDYNAFDPGPSAAMAKLLTGIETGLPWPDFNALGVTEHNSLFPAGWFYRGRLEDARVLVLADQESHDDMFSTRAATGAGGQRLQTLLGLLGVDTHYGILRSLPVDTTDLAAADALKVATDPKVVALLKQAVTRIVALGVTKRIVTVGPLAKAQLALMGITGVPIVNLDAPDDALAHVKGWQDALAAIGIANASSYTGKLTDIPRLDLPLHTKWWVGTGGSRAARGYNTAAKRPDPDYYKIYMPHWVAGLKPAALSPLEQAALLKAPK